MLAETVPSWTRQWLQQGVLQGEAHLLERVLTKRFGPLPQATRTQLTNATTEQLEYWADRVLDAPTLQAVFGDLQN